MQPTPIAGVSETPSPAPAAPSLPPTTTGASSEITLSQCLELLKGPTDEKRSVNSRRTFFWQTLAVLWFWFAAPLGYDARS